MKCCNLCPQCSYRVAGENGRACPQCVSSNESHARFKRDSDDLDRYREMFPIPPWSTDSITPEVCERLGMVRTTDQDDIGEYRVGPVEVCFENIGAEVYFESGGKMKHIPEHDYNSGQLSCLVAARKIDAKH